jgi:fructose-bisphosphate aldolase class II
MAMLNVAEIMKNARRAGVGIPAFNVPYLPMVKPVIQAVADQDSFALIEVARLEWVKFEAKSTAAVAEEFAKWNQPKHVRLHLDHVPVIDEDKQLVDYLAIVREALSQGYQSVMVDGSRLTLEENIKATRQVAELAHAAGVPAEAELGAVLGHEAGPIPPYEELFASGRGFTDVAEAKRFVKESTCDWLSVAIGNIHGAIAAGQRDLKKVEARVNLQRLEQLSAATDVPLVLHGGSGIRADSVREATKRGIAKVNVGTEIRQVYEVALKKTGSVPEAQHALYEHTSWIVREYFGNAGIRSKIAE